jgi:hypothetical protein
MTAGSTEIAFSCGRYYDVLAYPNYCSLRIQFLFVSANYEVIGLLQCMSHPKPPCHFLCLRTRLRAFGTLTLWDTRPFELYLPFKANTICIMHMHPSGSKRTLQEPSDCAKTLKKLLKTESFFNLLNAENMAF